MGSHSSTQGHMKIFKIRTLKGNSKYGIGCRNLKELLEKGCKKFQVQSPAGYIRKPVPLDVITWSWRDRASVFLLDPPFFLNRETLERSYNDSLNLPTFFHLYWWPQAADTIKEVEEQLPLKSTRVCSYEDGTELSDEYLRNLPDNTELVLLTAEQTWNGFVTDIDRLLNAFYTRQTDVTEAALKLLTDEQAPQRRKILVDFIQNMSENISAENREDDKSWFEGLEPRYKNKSSYMRNSCESRIRSYMKEVQSSATASDPAVRDEYMKLIETMSSELRAVKYNGYYFDRTEEKTSRLCTAEGWFSCHGPFDMDDCSSKHSINPYSNRESRILFSTWNLDHRIEKKRTILPCLTQALLESNGRQINWKYFFNLLFTMENLKLVHIACHKKTCHNLKCDDSMIYIKRKPARKIKN